MSMIRYDHDKVTKFAVALHDGARGKDFDFTAAMRAEFPGISYEAMLKAIDAAKMVVAVRDAIGKDPSRDH